MDAFGARVREGETTSRGVVELLPGAGSLITGVDLTLGRLRFITPANLLALPAAVVPTGVSEHAMPTSVQIYEDRFRDDIALTVAEAIEAGSESIMAFEHN